jgi:putative YpdA family bacillithiol system oxidoreductase
MDSSTLITLSVAAFLIFAVVVPYARRMKRKETKARQSFEHAKITGLNVASSIHPHIDVIACIGCGACVDACPEGDVLGLLDGKAVLIHGSKCIGHGLCAEVCPVGGITLLMAAPGRSANLPVLTSTLETTVPGVYIAGELGGIGLIKNAFTQGRKVVEQIAARPRSSNGAVDVAIVGAGPAGIAAGLAAKQLGLRYALLEQGTLGGSILHYPARKIVMTSPADLPIWGSFKFREVSKEQLLEVFQQILAKTGLTVHENSKVLDIAAMDGVYRLKTASDELKAKSVVLAMGRRGTPRKLGVPGEDHSKVMYRLTDAESYSNCKILVVGGGDSAVEAAVGLAFRGTNQVVLSYRSAEFSRIKERNRVNLEEQRKSRRLQVVMNSKVTSILPDKVTLETAEGPLEYQNDYIFVFAGGEMPFEFLNRVGIQFHAQEVA